MKKKRIYPVLCIFFLFLVCAKPPQLKGPEPRCETPIGVCFVREMDFIPEYDSWPVCTVDVAEEITADLQQAWEKKAPEITKLLTPDIAKELSQWAQEQMKEYDSIPPLSSITFKPVRGYNNWYKFLYEATVDTLPTHSNIVTRWLKVFVLYDKMTKSILRTTVTIRGEKLE